MIAEVDDQLGRIFDWLDATGQADNTLVVLHVAITASCSATTGSCRSSAGSTSRSTCRSSSATRAPSSTRHAAASVDAFTEHVDVLPTICELLGTDVPLQCDGRPLTPWLDGETPTDWRTRGALTSSTSAIPTAACSKTRSASRSRSARSRCCATTTASTCSSPATTRCRRSSSTSTTIPRSSSTAPPTPRTQPKVLDYAQRMLAWRMQPHRTHAHRHEAHRPRRLGRAPRRPRPLRRDFHELASETPDKRSFLTPVRTAEPRELNVHPSRPIRGDPTSTWMVP